MTTALSLWLHKDETRERISKALGTTFDPDFFIEQMLMALQHPSLDHCTDASKVQTVHACAALKLLPGMQHVVLAPARNDDTGTTECTAIPQWQGLAALIARHPHIEYLAHALVHPDDEFEFDGTTQSVVRHDYDPFAEDRAFRTIDDVRGGYVTVFFHDDRAPLYHIVKRSTLQTALQAAAADNSWQPAFEMRCVAALYQDCLVRRVVPVDPQLDPQQLQAAMSHEQGTAGDLASTVNGDSAANNGTINGDSSRNGRATNGRVNGTATKFANRTATLASRLSAGAIPEENSMPAPTITDPDCLFAACKTEVLTAATMDELREASEKIERSTGRLTAEQISELKDLVNSVADALTD